MNKEKLNDNEILELASIFNKRNAFYGVYDRSHKYFYNLVTTSFPRLKDIGIGDFIYLNDVFSENLGERKEGMELKTGFQLNHRKGTNTSEEFSLAGIYLKNEYYRNLSLYTQIGYDLFVSVEKSIDEYKKVIGNQDKVAVCSMEPKFLWNISDRFLFEISFPNAIYYTEFKDPNEFNLQGPIIFERKFVFKSKVINSFLIYLENNLYLRNYVNIDYSFTASKVSNNTIRQNLFNWRAGFNITYYISRGIN